MSYKIATIHVSGISLQAVDLNPIPMGISGAVVEIIYDDPLWEGLTTKVAFKGAAADEVDCDSNFVTLPHKVVAQKNVNVEIGITGVNVDDAVVIPTLWCDLGVVRNSAYSVHDFMPGEYVPPVLKQLLEDVETLEEEVEELKKNPSGGGLTVIDDGEGNVTITASGTTQITDDGNGNVVIS